MNTDSKSNAGPERDRIDTYLDDVCAEFTFMPSTDVERNRLELRQHIEAMVDDIVDTEGETREAAVGIAIVRFGDARTVGKRIADASPIAWLWKRNWLGGPLWITWIDALVFAPMLYVLEVSMHRPPTVPYLWLAFLLIGALGTVCDLVRNLYTTNAEMSLEDLLQTTKVDNTRPFLAKSRLAAELVGKAFQLAASKKKDQKQRLWKLLFVITCQGFLVLTSYDEGGVPAHHNEGILLLACWLIGQSITRLLALTLPLAMPLERK